MNSSLTTYVLMGLVGLVFSCAIAVVVQRHIIHGLVQENAVCEAQEQLQNAEIDFQKKQGDALQAKIFQTEKTYIAELSQQQKRAKEIQEIPIIDDCTGAVHWGSKKSAEIAAHWVDRN